VDVDVGWAILIVKDALIFLNWPQEEDDGVMHEGESLAGLPIPEDGVVVCFVLSLGKNADC